MTQNTTDDAAARLIARGEPVTLKAVLNEQSTHALHEKRVAIPKGDNRLKINRVGKIGA